MSATKPSLLGPERPKRGQEPEAASPVTRAPINPPIFGTGEREDRFKPTSAGEHTEPLGVRVEHRVKDRLTAYCASRQVTKRSVVEAVLNDFFDSEGV